jgi:long-chain acyl-CoA synthetase
LLYANVYNLFRERTARYGERAVFHTKNADGVWDSATWTQFADDVRSLACALGKNGLRPGAGVAVLAGSVPEWSVADIAAITAGGVGVGLYPSSSPEQCEFIINHSGSEFVVTDTVEQRDKILSIRARLPKVREVLCVADSTFAGFLSEGRDLVSTLFEEIESAAAAAGVEDTAILVYTSGTTGRPKGAMLSHRYILNSVESLHQSVPIFETDIALSYLPGCHVAERISGIYNRLYSGTEAYFIADLSKLYSDMLEVRPTVFASLPRFFEKIHASLLADKPASDITRQDLKDAFGGRVRLLTSGGAPLPPEIARFFADRGLPILQAYGLTENICTAFNTERHFKFGTVGRPMPMCQVRVADDSEIQLRSPMMFSGYYKDGNQTAEMFTDDGWMKTGDLGRLDEDGFLSITGRKKEIIVLSTGKNVAPALIENFVKESHMISHCFLYGDGRPYCVALVTLNPAEMRGPGLNAVEIRQTVEEIVERANARVSRPEQIKKFVILDEDFSPLRDEVTPTMKLKRDVIARNYEQQIERMYEQNSI